MQALVSSSGTLIGRPGNSNVICLLKVLYDSPCFFDLWIYNYFRFSLEIAIIKYQKQIHIQRLSFVRPLPHILSCHNLGYQPNLYVCLLEGQLIFVVFVEFRIRIKFNKKIKNYKLILFTKFCKSNTTGECKSKKKNSNCNSKHFFSIFFMLW